MELLIFCVHVYPGFHFGLCPHYTLGHEEVSCLKALAISLSFDAVALLIKSINLTTSFMANICLSTSASKDFCVVWYS